MLYEYLCVKFYFVYCIRVVNIIPNCNQRFTPIMGSYKKIVYVCT